MRKAVIRKGQHARELQTEDVVAIRPGVVHCHGVAADNEFSHLSVIPNPEKKDIWLEVVSLVTQSFPSRCVAVGNLCRVIREF